MLKVCLVDDWGQASKPVKHFASDKQDLTFAYYASSHLWGYEDNRFQAQRKA